jgi:uncharacterized Zn finger protein
MIPNCPHCGKEDFVIIKGQWRGPGEYIYDLEGEYLEAESEKLYFEPSDTVRCGSCGKIRRDLRLVDGKIVVI